ncbi:MAG: 4'-phosphopantetheinyl transferase superfamily protein [Fuerstiella sp.]
MPILTPSKIDSIQWAALGKQKNQPMPGLPTVWAIDLANLDAMPWDVESTLTAQEKSRRDQFKVAMDRQRFAVGRAGLRRLLGFYLDIPPQAVALCDGPFGKPAVPVRDREQPVHFNVAHSGDLVLLAFHASCEIGVDVEQVSDRQDWGDVAQRQFAAEQYDAWRLLNAEQQHRAFFREWTRREAGLKAIGTGFAIEQPVGWDSQLEFFELELPAGYAGAVALAPRTGMADST